MKAVRVMQDASAKSLETYMRRSQQREPTSVGRAPYLADATDVLVPGLVIKAEVLVQAEADVVAVETVGELVEVKEILLQSACDGGLKITAVVRIGRSCVYHAVHLSTCAQAGEPEGDTLLLEQLGALGRVDGTGVEDDVGGHYEGSCVRKRLVWIWRGSLGGGLLLVVLIATEDIASSGARGRAFALTPFVREGLSCSRSSHWL